MPPVSEQQYLEQQVLLVIFIIKGPYAGAILGYIGSDLIFPHNHEYIYDDDVKELRLCAGSGYSNLGKFLF